jgi:hypothetical protein
MRALALALLVAIALPVRGEAQSRDPGRARYLFAPSAFLLRGGEVVFAQTEVLFSSVSVGIGDHVNVLAGTASPVLMAAGSNSFNLGLGLKAGFSPARLVHVAVGFQTLTLPNVTGGYAFGVTSFGRETAHVTLGGGAPLLATGVNPTFGPPFVFAAGSVSLWNRVALATENWWFPTRPEIPSLHAGLLRLLVWRFSLGLGAAHIAPLRFPLPWIDLSVHLGG